MNDVKEIFDAIISGGKAFGSVSDVVTRLVDGVKKLKKSGNLSVGSEGFAKSVEGKEISINTANFTVNQNLSPDRKAVPFLIRIGQEFPLAVDSVGMQEAIDHLDTWDWTFVVNAKLISDDTRNQLKSQYFDQEDVSFMRSESTTSALFALNDIPALSDIADVINLSGVVISNASYVPLPSNIAPEDILPNRVVMVDMEKNQVSKCRMAEDPFMVEYYFQEILEILATETGKSPAYVFASKTGADKISVSSKLRSILGMVN